jgi:hypothetical protein
MTISRRKFSEIAAVAAGASLAGCRSTFRHSPSQPLEYAPPADAGPLGSVRRVLNRLCYGPRPGDVERVASLGVQAFIEEQLHPERIEENPRLTSRLRDFDTLNLDASEAQDFDRAGDFDTVITPFFSYLFQYDLKSTKPGEGQTAVELQQACVLRAVYGARQLHEVMTEFWSDHFNISQLNADCAWLKTVDDRRIRRHALGKFRDLLGVSAHSPAMLFYLDNNQNRKRDPEAGTGINENYARELLELHTLGVDGGYTLQDVREVARCFTGWTLGEGFSLRAGEFIFEAEHHDDGPKTVLGVYFPAGQGELDGEQVLDLISRHPSTARLIARKLCRRFVAEEEPPQLVARLAETFLKSDGDIRQVLSALFHSEEFLRHGAPKFKRPFDYVVSTLRALDAETDGKGVLPHLEKMGQPLFRWAMPDGYPERAEAWTPSLIARWNFAHDLLTGRIAGTEADLESLARSAGGPGPLDLCRGFSRLLLGVELPAGQLSALAEIHDRQRPLVSYQQWAALLLAAPHFQWR